jgi:hypothetical protein
MIPGVFLNSQDNQKKININYSKMEQKALRYEMIEQDIFLRTISSMISLGNADRLKYWFEKLTVLSTSESLYYKKNIASVMEKWKKQSIDTFMNNIRIESGLMVKYIGKFEESKYEGLDWAEVNKSFFVIIDNCRGCHSSLEVKIP